MRVCGVPFIAFSCAIVQLPTIVTVTWFVVCYMQIYLVLLK